MKFKTTHELAEYLLSKEDCPVRHHFYYHENFNDNGYDFISSVDIIEKSGKVYITEDEYLEEDF